MSSQSSTSVPPLFDISRDLLVTDEHEKANTLNNYFANQSCIDDSSSSLPDERFQIIRQTLDSIHVMPSEVLDVLKTLKIGKASGPDGINNRVLIETDGQLAPQFCDLYNYSLNTCSVPASWKISNIPHVQVR